MSNQVQQVDRGGCHGVDDRLVETEDDRQLNQSWQTGSERVDAQLFVQSHLLLSQFFFVALVFLLSLDPLFILLQILHALSAFDLFDHQRVSDKADQQREQDNGDAEVLPDQVIDEQQHVDKRRDN